MDRLTAMEFTRDPGPLALHGFRSCNQETLRLELDRAGLQGSWVVADLSVGAWRGHQVAREFCAQLAVKPLVAEFLAAETMNRDQDIEIAYADVIGKFIDAEASGDRATITSLHYARQIRDVAQGATPRVFMVVIPRYGMPWEPENVLFIRLFAQALKSTRSTLALIATGEGDPEVPVDWTIAWSGGAQTSRTNTGDDIVGLIPGVIAPDLADMFHATGLPGRENLIPLANGHWLVPFERRRPPTAVPRLDFDRLGTLARSHGWLDAYAQYYGNKMYVDPWFLYAQAQQRFAEGGTGITLRLMERALAQVRVGLEWGILQAYAQGLRVASFRFADAAGIADPPTTLPADLHCFLLQCKGWGLVMIDELAHAEECFRRARELTDPESRDRREYLYLLNISALCRMKAGELEIALGLELEIEERRKRLSPPDRRLQYVNAINIARLYRRRGQPEKAERYFRDAFATTLGARTESDAVHANVILARLSTASGKHAQAFIYWMRAGLHWAASDVPEAVGGRIVRHIIAGAPEGGASVPEAVAASLSACILSAAADSGLAEVLRVLPGLVLDTGCAPTFVRAESARRTLPHATIDSAVLSAGLSVFAMREAIEPHTNGEHSMRLRILLYTLLEMLAPPGFLTAIRTIVVDDSLGREMAATPEELVAACVRLDVRHVAIEGDVRSFTVDDCAKIERCLRVHVGCAVESVVFRDGCAEVSFKRYFSPTSLTVEESRLLTFVENGPTVDEIIQRCGETASQDDVLQMLRRLEQKRVLNIDPAGSKEFSYYVT
jgi:tetratricopeptide (TPR) repeat protein